MCDFFQINRLGLGAFLETYLERSRLESDFINIFDLSRSINHLSIDYRLADTFRDAEHSAAISIQRVFRGACVRGVVQIKRYLIFT
jgi:hypothetical protein